MHTKFIIIVLLINVSFLQSSALSIEHDPLWDLPDLLPAPAPAPAAFVPWRDCALLREMLIAHREIRVHVEREPVLSHREHVQQQEIIVVTQPKRNKQKKQKQQYYNNNKNNNRADRQKHAQSNRRIQQPQQRGRKK